MLKGEKYHLYISHVLYFYTDANIGENNNHTRGLKIGDFEVQPDVNLDDLRSALDPTSCNV